MVTYRVSKVIKAPIRYVYDWATDFTEGDNVYWGGKHRRVILLKTKEKVVYANIDGTDSKLELAVGVVILSPSTYSWHLDYYGEKDTETGEYKLTSLGKERTKLGMVFHNKWKNGKGPSAKSFEKGTALLWEKYAKGLEKDYSSGKKATSA